MKYKNILINQIRYLTIKDLNCVKINSVNSLYLIIGTINRHIEENNENKCLTLVPTDKSEGKLRKYEKIATKIRDLIRSVSNKSDDYDKTLK